MDNIVVIGGAGFIGLKLSRQLRDAGHRVKIVSRSARLNEEGITSQAIDITDHVGIRGALQGADVVYDLSMSGGANWDEVRRNVVEPAVNVGRTCLTHGVRRLIYASSISALYLGGRGTISEEEGADLTHAAERGTYGRGKIESERALLEMHARERLPLVIMRPGVVLGEGGFLLHGALGDPGSDTHVLGFGSGEAPLPCVLAEDVARAMVLAKDVPGLEGQAFNLAGDVRLSAREYIRVVRELTRRDFQYHPRPVWKLQGMELLRYAVKRVLRGKRATRQSLRDFDSMQMTRQLDCGKAKRVLGWQPVSDRDEFIRRAIACHVRPIPAGDPRLARPA